MKAMVLERPGQALRLRERPVPRPGPGELLVRVRACAVCRTDLHLVDGELPDPAHPIVPGHEIVGVVEEVGEGAGAPEGREGRAADSEGVGPLRPGARVGIPWLGWTCGACPFCRTGQENLCDEARFTGYQRDGGYAEYAVADARYAFPLPADYDDLHAAPLLCAGLIGYRSLRMAYETAGEVRRLGLYGFGAAAHIVTQVATHQGREVLAFTRPGDEEGQVFARSLGAAWAGGSDRPPPRLLDAAIIFAPVGALVPVALRAVRKGGAVISAGIHMSSIPAFPYRDLWGERTVRSVANLTRRDGKEFLAYAPEVPVRTEVTAYPLEEANRALDDLREGRLKGAAVLRPSPPA